MKTLTIDDLYLLIMQADEFDLDITQAAIDSRRKQLGLAPATQVVEQKEETGHTKQFRVGDAVIFNALASPKYLHRNGITGTVTRVNDKTVMLEIENSGPAGRFAGKRNVRTPKTIVDLVP
jgi:hypothetical protein